ncbi:MAG: glycosyltransferase, partial [Blastocatellia bacterium]
SALVLPTRVNEAFGLCIAEALMSGTPVICSDKGACPELVSGDVGFVCKDHADYVRAFSLIKTIDSKACRERALKEFHYLRMATDYLREYKRELNAPQC